MECNASYLPPFSKGDSNWYNFFPLLAGENCYFQIPRPRAVLGALPRIWPFVNTKRFFKGNLLRGIVDILWGGNLSMIFYSWVVDFEMTFVAWMTMTNRVTQHKLRFLISLDMHCWKKPPKKSSNECTLYAEWWVLVQSGEYWVLLATLAKIQSIFQ